MSVAMPTITTEIRFSAGAGSTGFELGTAILGYSTLGSATTTWSDVSSDARTIAISRGKRRELDEYSAGSAVVKLSNTARTYDPTYAAGAYYGQIKPGRWIRIKATYDSVEYQLYQGVIRGWGFNYSFPNEATATPRATDFITDLNNAKISTTTTAGLSGVGFGDILNSANIIPRDLDAGQGTMQAVTLSNANALTALQTMDKSEGGGLSALYCNTSNQVVFEDRQSLSTNTRSNTSQATFGTSALPVDTFEIEYSSDLIKNDVSLTRIGGSAQTATDSDSQADYGIRSFNLTGLYNSSDTDVLNLAFSYVNTFKDAELRVRSITIHPRANNALMIQALTRQIRDRVTISYEPPPGGTTVTEEVFISGVEHSINPEDFQTKFLLESTTGRGGYWTLGTGTLGETTTLGF
jgi:hypothetical protein